MPINHEWPSDVDALQLYINSAQEKAETAEKFSYESYLNMVVNPGFVKQYKKINESGVIIKLTPTLGYSGEMAPNLYLVYGKDENNIDQIQLQVRQEHYNPQQGSDPEIIKRMEEVAREGIPTFKTLHKEPWQETVESMNGGPNVWLKRTLPVTAELLDKYQGVGGAVFGGIAEGLVGFKEKLDKKPRGLFFNNNRLLKTISSLQSATAQILQLIK